MKWPTQFNRPLTVASVSGVGVVDTRKLEVQKDGKKKLVKSGKLNLYEYIQSHADSVDLKRMIERYNSGDPTALHRRDGVYIDTSEMPTTYAEWQQRFMDLEHVFDRLPIEIKEQYDHDVGMFVQDVGSPAFFDKVGKYNALQQRMKEDIVKTEDPRDPIIKELENEPKSEQ